MTALFVALSTAILSTGAILIVRNAKDYAEADRKDRKRA